MVSRKGLQRSLLQILERYIPFLFYPEILLLELGPASKLFTMAPYMLLRHLRIVALVSFFTDRDHICNRLPALFLFL